MGTAYLLSSKTFIVFFDLMAPLGLLLQKRPAESNQSVYD